MLSISAIAMRMDVVPISITAAGRICRTGVWATEDIAPTMRERLLDASFPPTPRHREHWHHHRALRPQLEMCLHRTASLTLRLGRAQREGTDRASPRPNHLQEPPPPARPGVRATPRLHQSR